MVVLFHIQLYAAAREHLAPGGWIADVLRRGDTGVYLFFGISGFILGLPFARAAAGSGKPVAVGRYLLRRVTRLEPPYIIAMTVLLAAYVVIRHQSLPELFPHHVASLGYVHGLLYHLRSPVNGVAWTLEIEVQFYLLAPILALAYRLPRQWLRIAVLCALGTATALLTLGPLETASWRPDLSIVSCLQYFVAGMVVAELTARGRSQLATDGSRPEPEGRRPWLWDWVGVAGLVLIVASAGNTSTRMLVLPFGVAACLLAALRGRVVPAVLGKPWIYLIGGMCYSIYLFHFAVISFAGPTTIRIHWGHSYLLNVALQASLLIPLILVVSGVFFVLVERPCMDPDWPTRLAAAFRGRRARTPTARSEVDSRQ